MGGWPGSAVTSPVFFGGCLTEDHGRGREGGEGGGGNRKCGSPKH
jgi:hypothetical protein